MVFGATIDYVLQGLVQEVKREEHVISIYMLEIIGRGENSS